MSETDNVKLKGRSVNSRISLGDDPMSKIVGDANGEHVPDSVLVDLPDSLVNVPRETSYYMKIAERSGRTLIIP